MSSIEAPAPIDHIIALGGEHMRTVSVILLALLSSSCTGTYGRQQRQIQASLLGLEGRRIISCIGAPHRIDRLDDSTGHELWRYQMPLDLDPPGGELAGDPLREQEAPVHPPPGQVAPLEIHQRFLRREPARPGLCTFLLELEGGSVRGLRVSGETPEGLTADLDCVRLLSRCVPEPVP